MSLSAAYEIAKNRYLEFGIDTDAAIDKALSVPISMHCWQADDVRGLEDQPTGSNAGGILATGTYPGRARNGDEMRADIGQAISLIPGTLRCNLHAMYAEPDEFVERDALTVDSFQKWITWARELSIKLDFNPSFFAHPKADDGLTLSHPDREIREFWIRHGRVSRQIAAQIAQAQGAPCHVNWWTPDGSKDLPADRFAPRALMAHSYDQIMDDASVDKVQCVDFIESKLFGIGSEEYVVSSAEFCAQYSLSRGLGLCLDMGHFHPTELIHDKISSHLQFMDRIMLHVSRPVRWDSDHVVVFNDDLKSLFLEIQRGGVWDRVTIALDFFDASINRVGAYVIGTRATRKAILYALLDPSQCLKVYENEGKSAQCLALMEEFKSMPFGAIWDMLCERACVPVGTRWLPEIESYESSVLSNR